MKGALKQFVDCNCNFFYYGLRISKYVLVHNDFKMKIKIWLKRNSYQFYCYTCTNTDSKGMDNWCKSLLILWVQAYSIFYNTSQKSLTFCMMLLQHLHLWDSDNSTNMTPAMGFEATLLDLTNKKNTNGWNDKQRAL